MQYLKLKENEELLTLSFVSKKQIFILLFTLFSFFQLSAQTYTVRGKITDRRTKEPLAFVNVVYGEGNLGTTTNIDGVFQLKTTNKELQLKCIYLGYKTLIQIVRADNPSLKEIALDEDVFGLNEVRVFPGENPAHRIIRSTIKNKTINDPEKLAAFSYLSYNRMHFTLAPDNKYGEKIDTLVISAAQANRIRNKNKKDFLRDFMGKQHFFLMETLSERLYNGPGKNKETIKASKTSGLKQPYIFLLATQFQSFTVYGNEVSLGSRKYVSPICDNCIDKYFYLIEDSIFNETGDTLFVISFRPAHGKNFDGLQGIMHINTNRYAVESIKAEPVDKDTTMDIRFQQKYSFVENKAWFPVELNTDITMKGFQSILVDTVVLTDSTALKTKQKFVMQGVGKTYLDSINLQPDLRKEKFGHVEVTVEGQAGEVDAAYFSGYRPDSLTVKDLNTYRVIDSLGEKMNLDATVRVMTVMMTGYIPYSIFNFDINRILAFNQFENFRGGLGFITNDKMLKWLSVGAYAGWGFRDEKEKYGYSLRLKLPEDEEIWLEYNHSFDIREPGKSDLTLKRNITSSEFFRTLLIPAADYFVQDRVRFSCRLLDYFVIETGYAQNQMNIHPDYRYFDDGAIITGDYRYQEANFGFRMLYREKFAETPLGKLSMGSNGPEINAGFSVGAPMTNSSNLFFRSELKVSHSFDFHFVGKTKITARAGFVQGNVPLSLLYNGYGSFAELSVDAENTFQSVLPLEFFNKSFSAIYIRHNFGNLLFKTGKFNPGIILCHNMGIGNMFHEKSIQLPGIQSFEKGFMESGIIITDLIKVNIAGYGIGVFYRYGSYASKKFTENLSVKISFSLKSF
jgi:hypothetical protein